MKPLKLSKVSCKYGAPMGRNESLPLNPQAKGKLQLAYVRFVYGCYDYGGAYWGMPANLYHSAGYLEGESEITELFVRAYSRNGAKELIKARFPNVSFFR